MIGIRRIWNTNRTIIYLFIILFLLLLFILFRTYTYNADTSFDAYSPLSSSSSNDPVIHSLHKRIQLLQQQLTEKNEQQQLLINKIETIFNTLGTIMTKWTQNRGGTISKTEKQLLDILNDKTLLAKLAESDTEESEHTETETETHSEHADEHEHEHEHDHEHEHTENESTAESEKSEESHKSTSSHEHNHPNPSHDKIPHQHRLTVAESANVTECHRLRQDYQVQMGRDW